MAIKVDLKKAYDSVSWNFLHQSMKLYGFTERWCNWIMNCVSTARFSVLCNGVLAGFFASGRGLRHGCPFSPLLFTLITDYFSTLMHEKIAYGQLKVCKMVQKSGFLVSHAFYADDLFIMVKANISTAKAIDGVFQKFHEVSGLGMNKQNSAVIFSKSMRSKRRLLPVLQVKVESFPIKYLGIPLVNRGLRSSDCKGIFDKATTRLEHWNTINLSLAGRIELLKILDVDFAAKAVIYWDFVKNKEALWVKWMHARYLQQESFWTIQPKVQDSSIWKQILDSREFIQENAEFRVGNGTSFNMLFDPWCAGLSLIHRFGADIFKNYDKQARLNTLIVDGRWSFPQFFSTSAVTFIANIVVKSGQDAIEWSQGRFNLKNVWKICRARGQIVGWKELSWKFCRPRVAVLVVIILHNKNLSCFNLQRRGFSGPAIYHNCFKEEDSNDHLFCKCSYALEVWQQVLNKLHISVVRFQGINQFVEWILLQVQVDCLRSKIIKEIFCVFIWKIWMERNVSLHGGSKEQASVATNLVVWEVMHFFSIGFAELMVLFDDA
ncbi:uncharacterized protein LOC132309031 [Cornus florida]|uniref:uncharacterized protein LOC132309031 n=1 Tax=Cornus florida TaxID=4283 RepID=UPI0028996B32|nr:uncharacterized protein LOC132309031 [Cornus florida]